MTGIAIRFLRGRFHATPWGRHVNEAAAEWPPSPWRLLRALVFTWKRKFAEDPACSTAVVEALLRKLAVEPVFSLPRTSVAHARYYQPLFHGKRTLVFDTFVCLEPTSLVRVIWPDVMLNSDECHALGKLLDGLGYLGRSESLVEATMMLEDEAALALREVNCAPTGSPFAPENSGPIRVLCADPIEAFRADHTPKSVPGKGRRRDSQHPVALYDPDWHLCMETLELHRQRWSNPPGSRWRDYIMSTPASRPEPRAPRRCALVRRPTIVRFALDAPVLPLLEETLPVAESARIAAMGCFRRAVEASVPTPSDDGPKPLPRSEVLSGKDANGVPLEGHRHAFYLPTDEDGDGRMDHLTIVAEMGFGPMEMRAFDRMTHLKMEGRDPIGLILLAFGEAESIAAPVLLGPSREWISATPFLATRYPKTRGRKKDPTDLIGPDNMRKFARQVLLEEIARLRTRRADIPEPIAVEPLNPEHRCGAHRLRPIQFKRFRRKRNDDGGRRAAGAFRIVFPEPVRGPICLGHSSHFGLGLFVPQDR